jgi:hypothetical protein
MEQTREAQLLAGPMVTTNGIWPQPGTLRLAFPANTVKMDLFNAKLVLCRNGQIGSVTLQT